MVARSAAPGPFHQLNTSVLFALGIMQWLGMGVALVLSGLTFISWTVPVFSDVLPDFFRLMRANNAFLGLVCATSLVLLHPGRSPVAARIGGALGGFVVFFASLLLASDFGWIGLGINTLLAQDPTHAGHGRVSPEAAFTYLLVGFVLLTLTVRRRPWSYVSDFISFSLCLTLANFLASYILGLSHLFNIDPKNPFALQTYILLTVLTAVSCSRRAEFGLFRVLLSRGIGGQFARLAAPLALLLPFAFALSTASLTKGDALPDSVVTARATSGVSMVAFCIVVFLAFRTNRLESTMEELIIRDDLTQLYNRRGFMRRADTSLRLAQRERVSFLLAFIDLDGLRRVNHTFGYRTGSDCLCQMASLLETSFGESAIIARVGGGGFAIAAQGDSARCSEMISLLESAVVQPAPGGEAVTLTFSLGFILSRRSEGDNLTRLIEKAERKLYAAKQAKQYAS